MRIDHQHAHESNPCVISTRRYSRACRTAGTSRRRFHRSNSCCRTGAQKRQSYSARAARLRSCRRPPCLRRRTYPSIWWSLRRRERRSRIRRGSIRQPNVPCAGSHPVGSHTCCPRARADCGIDLTRRGLRQTDMLLHVPDISRSRYVVPIGTPAAHYVLSGRVAMSRSRRLAAAALMRSRRLAALGPTGVIFQRDPPAPLAAWLFELHPSLEAGSVLASRGGRRAAPSSFCFLLACRVQTR